MIAHTETGYGGRDRVHEFCKQRGWVIARSACKIFVSCCSLCNRKRIPVRSGVVAKPIISDGYNMRVQIDLVDFQTFSDGDDK